MARVVTNHLAHMAFNEYQTAVEENAHGRYRWWIFVAALPLVAVIVFSVLKAIDWANEKAGIANAARSKQGLLASMRNDPYYTAIEKRFPAIAMKAIERGWQVRERGGNDSEIGSAMRKAMMEIYPILVGQADDASLEAFAGLIVEQAKAARSVSYEACGKLLDSELNIALTLPGEYFEREQAWVIRALKFDGNHIARRNSQVIQASLKELRARVTPDQLEAVENPAKYRGRPASRCDSAIALYEAALTLPPAEKAAALEGLLKR